MNTSEGFTIDTDLLAQIQGAAQRAVLGARDRELMKQAFARMDRRREKIYREHGLLDIGVPAIRTVRDEG